MFIFIDVLVTLFSSLSCMVDRLGLDSGTPPRSSSRGDIGHGGVGGGGVGMSHECVVVSGSLVDDVGVVVRGLLCGGPPSPRRCVECGEQQWSFGGPNDCLIKGVVWSCGGCSAFLPYIPPSCSLSIGARETIVRDTPTYCGDECQINHWFKSHHKSCRRDDIAMYGYVHLSTPSLHDVMPAPFGRRIVRDGVVTHVPYLHRIQDSIGARHV